MGVRVVQPARIAKGLEAGVAVVDDCAPHVVVHLLGYAAGFGVYDQTHAAQVVADDLVALARANHGAGAVGFVGVDVEGFELAAFVGVGYGAQVVLVNQAVLPLAVFAFAYAPAQGVDGVFDALAVGQADLAQLAQAVVGVGACAPGGGFALELACAVVGVGVVFPAQELVLAVVGGDQLAVFVGAVAVGVVLPVGGVAVVAVGDEAACVVVAVAVFAAAAGAALGLGADTAQQVALVGEAGFKAPAVAAGLKLAKLLAQALVALFDFGGVEAAAVGRNNHYLLARLLILLFFIILGPTTTKTFSENKPINFKTIINTTISTITFLVILYFFLFLVANW